MVMLQWYAVLLEPRSGNKQKFSLSQSATKRECIVRITKGIGEVR